MFTEDEKKLLKMLVKKELDDFESEEKIIHPEMPQLLAIEESYDEFLKKLLEKLK